MPRISYLLYVLREKIHYFLLPLFLFLFVNPAFAATVIINNDGGACPFSGTNGGSKIFLGDTSQVQLQRCNAAGTTGNVGQYFNSNATPTHSDVYNSVFLRIGSTVYGANNFPNWANAIPFTSVSNTGGSSLGDGTVTTVYQAVEGGLSYTITQTVTYYYPNDFYTVKLDVNVPAGNTQFVRLYSWTDIMLDGDDRGTCARYTTFPEYIIADNTAQTVYAGYRQRSIANHWDRYFCGPFAYPVHGSSTMITTTGTGNLDNTIEPTNVDVGAAVQWDIGAVANTTFTADYDFVFSLKEPTLTKRYGPNDEHPDHSMSVGDTVPMTFTITNRPGTPAQGSMNFTETLPLGVTVVGTPNAAQCGGTVTKGSSSGRDVITLTGGMMVGGATSCDITFNITASAVGAYDDPAINVTAINNLKNLADATLTVTGAALSLEGTVFEDINYGGGAGRSLAAASGAGINGASVELYNSTGALVASTTTTNTGAYSFNSVAAGDYYVRVVNPSVKSTRSGGGSTELGVQTFRTDGANPITNEVGGRNPAVADSTVNSGSETLNTSTFVLSGGGQAQSVQPVTVGASAVSGVDFGFNFSTIVNTNNTGQGSLRQFILNSNLLANTGLDQVDNPSDGAPDPAAGVETSIFMIPSVGPHTINLTSALPTITGAATAIDASTQAGSSCSVSNRTLMVTLNGGGAGVAVNGLAIDAANVKVRGIAIGQFSESGINGSANADGLQVTCSHLGLAADGTTLLGNTLHGLHARSGLSNLVVGGSSADQRNILSGNSRNGIFLEGASLATIEHNYIGTSADGLLPRSNNREGASYAGIATSTAATSDITIRNNLISGGDIITGAGPVFNVTSGIRLENLSKNITITGNLIGTNPSGTGALANTGYGIYIHNSTDITIGGTTVAERNIISGNGKDGINTRFGTKRLNIYGNYIGVDSTGALALGNTDNGIFLADTQTTNIGNADPSGRNIITGNKISGIRNSTSTSTVIAGNYVGLDAAGTAALGNTLHGIYVQNSATVAIGGATAGARNIVSGNKVIGVYVVGATSNTRIEGNTIGLLADGDTAAGNTQAGIETSLTNGVVIHNNIVSANKTRGIHPINSPSTTITNNIIGLNAAGTAKRANLEHGIDVDTAASDLLVENNVLSGNNKAGIRIFSGTATNNRIINNKIGVGSDGITALGNLISGVWIDSTTGVLVGGTGANDANIIAHNTGDAVTLNGTNNKANIISRNIMFANSSLGIDLDEDNVTLNNGSALSTGANEGLNFPQFKQVILEGGNLTVNGCVPTGAIIELFEADVSPTSSAGVATGANQAGRTQDYGEGERYLATFVEGVGEETPTTTIDCATLTDSDANNATGMSVFQWTIPAPSNVVLGDKLTATATLAASGTSEFSSIATASLGNAAPEITSNGGGASAALSVAENQTAATTVTATDANPSDTLTYSISGGADAARFSINASTGVLTFNTAPDFELPTDADTNNVYELQVTVADGNGGTDVQTISVTVTDVIETVNPAFPDGVGLADSVCGVKTATSTTTDAGIYWSHNASGGTSLAAQIARTDLVVSANDEAAIGLVSQAQSGSTQVNMATIPAQYDPTKYLQYTFTTADLAGKVAELTGLSMSVYHKGDAADTFATGAYHFAIQVDDDPAFGSPATLISDVGLNNGDTSEATVAAAPVDLGQGVQTMLRFDANGATVPLVSNTAYTIRVFIYGVSAAGSASTQPYPTVALWDDIMFKLVSCGYDRGDAPAAYGDPAHKILGSIKMGAGDPDPELAAQAGVNADGDDTHATDDENGVTLPTFIQGTTTSIQVTVSGAGYLQAWIDWNGNNTFDASEQIATDLQDNGVGDTNSNAGTITFNVTVPSDAVLTPTYARFRWSSTSGLNNSTAANDGEVEDYALTVDTAFVPTLPTAVCTMNAYGWADTHIPVSTGGGEPSPPYYLTTGSYDWNQAGNPAWPNSKTPTQTLSGAVALALPDLSATDSLSANNEGWMTVTRLEGAPSSAGTIRMYDAGAAEHKVYLVKDALGNVLTRYPVAPSTSERNLGAVTLSFTYPSDGIAYVHVYVADYSGFRDVPYVTDCNQDRSDAPLVGTSYGEALHNILSTFYLGTQIDIDASTIANVAADGEGADDDGITLPSFARGQTVSISASVTGINGYLQAWVDWNGDGDFADAGEQIVTDMQDNGASDTNAATGQMTFTVNVPNDAVAAPTYARFRWSNVAGLDSITPALNGEVEDYQLVINATPEITSNGGGATASVSVAEGSTAVTTVTATDANTTDTLIYSISGGADAAKLAIDANTGALSFVTAPNFATPSDADTNNVYEVQVTVSDGQVTDVQDLSVTVTDVDAQVLEYTVRRTPDGRYHVYMRPTLNTVLGPNLSLTGQITLTVPTGIGANQFVVSDLQNLVPSVTWSQTSRTNAPVENTGTDYLSFTFTPNGSDQFNWQAGVELEVFNFANPNACMGMVDVMDDTDAFNTLPNSVNSVPSNQFTNTGWGTPTDNNYLGNYGSPVDCVNNVAPLITSNGGNATASISVPENQTAVTTVTATDANATDILTYSITGGADAALFSIDPNTGVLSFNTAPNYEAPSDSGTNNSYDVQVSVSDGNSHSDVQDIAVTVTDVPEGVTIQIRGLLQGPFNASTGLMEDTLRTLSLIPSNQPYTIAPFNYSGADVLNNTLLVVSGNDAIVDWVLVELRAAADPLTVVAQKAALLQRDGDVVMADTGALNIDFLGVNDGSYYVALRHRNHLGVMSASALALSPVPTVVDFTLPATAVYGTHARISSGSLALMWAADANKSNQVIANGPNNDTSDILGSVLMEGGNTLLNSNYKLLGYRVTDLDLNGITLFAGPNNDTNLLLGNVLLHPANSTFSANFVIHGGIPNAQ